MHISLDQLFYGRGERGYAILGASPGAEPFAARVESLCGGVGTPAADYGGEPFLLSVPDGDRVLLVCGRRGAPDSMERGTLFFHALVAEKTVLAAAKADAFSLFDQGAFADKMPTGEIKALHIDAKPGRNGSTSRPAGGRIVDASQPCVFRSDCPAADLVRAALGGRANDYAWVTFAFQALPRFDVQVLPPRVTAPAGCSEYDDNGILLRAARTVAATDSRRTDQPPQQPVRTIPVGPESSKPSPMLKLSLAANVVLAVLCAVLFIGRKTPEPVHVVDPAEKPAEASLSPEQRKAIEQAAVETYKKTATATKEDAVKVFRSKLAQAFPLESHIGDFEHECGKFAWIGQFREDNTDFKVFLDKLNDYVLFVNTNLLENTTP